MKLFEITAEGQEPMLVTLMRQRLAKGQRIARYYRSGDSIKPMWIMSMERVERAGGPGIAPSVDWVFRCNKGNNVDYLSYDEEDFDNNFELIPGKTKNTWQFRRRPQDHEGRKAAVGAQGKLREGRGEELMAFSDFADTAYPKRATRLKYDTLAAELFKRGFSFSISPKGTAGRFKKEVDGEGIQLSIVGDKAPTHSNRRVVIVSFSGHDPGTGEPRGKHQSYEVDDLVDDGADLDFVLNGGST